MKGKMKKTIITLILTLMTSSVFAYSCPALWTELDYEINLAKNSGMSEEKIKEVARMLSGKVITEEAMKAAKKLIENMHRCAFYLSTL